MMNSALDEVVGNCNQLSNGIKRKQLGNIEKYNKKPKLNDTESWDGSSSDSDNSPIKSRKKEKLKKMNQKTNGFKDILSDNNSDSDAEHSGTVTKLKSNRPNLKNDDILALLNSSDSDVEGEGLSYKENIITQKKSKSKISVEADSDDEQMSNHKAAMNKSCDSEGKETILDTEQTEGHSNNTHHVVASDDSFNGEGQDKSIKRKSKTLNKSHSKINKKSHLMINKDITSSDSDEPLRATNVTKETELLDETGDSSTNSNTMKVLSKRKSSSSKLKKVHKSHGKFHESSDDDGSSDDTPLANTKSGQVVAHELKSEDSGSDSCLKGIKDKTQCSRFPSHVQKVSSGGSDECTNSPGKLKLSKENKKTARIRGSNSKPTFKIGGKNTTNVSTSDSTEDEPLSKVKYKKSEKNAASDDDELPLKLEINHKRNGTMKQRNLAKNCTKEKVDTVLHFGDNELKPNKDEMSDDYSEECERSTSKVKKEGTRKQGKNMDNGGIQEILAGEGNSKIINTNIKKVFSESESSSSDNKSSDKRDETSKKWKQKNKNEFSSKSKISRCKAVTTASNKKKVQNNEVPSSIHSSSESNSNSEDELSGTSDINSGEEMQVKTKGLKFKQVNNVADFSKRNHNKKKEKFTEHKFKKLSSDSDAESSVASDEDIKEQRPSKFIQAFKNISSSEDELSDKELNLKSDVKHEVSSSESDSEEQKPRKTTKESKNNKSNVSSSEKKRKLKSDVKHEVSSSESDSEEQKPRKTTKESKNNKSNVSSSEKKCNLKSDVKHEVSSSESDSEEQKPRKATKESKNYKSNVSSSQKKRNLKSDVKHEASSSESDSEEQKPRKAIQASKNSKCNVSSSEEESSDKELHSKANVKLEISSSESDSDESGVKKRPNENVGSDSSLKREQIKSKKAPEDDKRIINLKKYLHIAGIRPKNYSELWKGCRSNKARVAKLQELLEKNGMKGRPTIEKCKKLRKKIETKKEIAELDVGNIMDDGGIGRSRRCTRGVLGNNNSHLSAAAEERAEELKNRFSRIKALNSSGSESD